MIVDGRAIAEEIYQDLSHTALRGSRLGILVSGKNEVIESFVRIKSKAAERLGVEMIRVDLPDNAGTLDAVSAVEGLSHAANAIIVQLPLLNALDTDAVLAAIPDEKDVDAINPRVGERAHTVEAPVALAVLEILHRADIEPRGKRAVVIGAGRLVGAPTAALLKRLGANVSMFTLEQGRIEDLKSADIIICGAGKPGFIRPEHINEGVVLIDAGASEQGGVVRGDADPACAEKASVFTPVPGGVGPIAVAMIFKNLLDLADTGVLT